MQEPTIYWIDLFCGAGGTTTGIHLAEANASVVACVNHDQMAIESHKANHPDCLHFTEDIRDFKVVQHLKVLVDKLRNENPECIVNIWASLECTNFSNAKGGMPRDGDSRTLAEHLFMYLEHLSPDYLYIENVREFMSWGPLDDKGKPISRKNGRDYLKWIQNVRDFGYKYDWKLLNAADYGAYTSRERYFGIFAKHGMPISFPQPSHVKKLPENEGMFKTELKKWKPVKDVLHLDKKGDSIFTRKKELSENTLKRIYAGLLKFVAGGEEQFTKVYNSGNDFHRVKSVDEPIGALTTGNSHAVVSTEWMMDTNFKNVGNDLEQPSRTILACRKHQYLMQPDFIQRSNGGNPKDRISSIEKPLGSITTSPNNSLISTEFIQQRNSGNPKSKIVSVDGPARTITRTGGNQEIVQSEFLTSYYGNGQPHDVNEPCPTVTTKDRFAVNYLLYDYSKFTASTMEQPAGTITTTPKHNLVTNEWLTDTQFGRVGQELEKPCFTLIARMDKKPPYLIQTESGHLAIQIFKDDNETMIKIKEFMSLYGIVDIKMRMLIIPELKAIQGFPKDYILKGTKTDQKRFIGNSVETTVARKLVESNFRAVERYLKIAV